MTELEETISLKERIKIQAGEFGLKLENSDNRRSIFNIEDEENFFAHAQELGIDVATRKKMDEVFTRYPDSLKQFFIINQPEMGKKIRLGEHFHTRVETGGSGKEIFIFLDVPVETRIKLEQYHLGRARGKIRYGVRSGAVMENNPEDYHVFESDGPFMMVQVLEGGFKNDDLIEFDVGQWSAEDERLVKGGGIN